MFYSSAHVAFSKKSYGNAIRFWQTVLTQIRPDKTSGPIWVKTTCQGCLLADNKKKISRRQKVNSIVFQFQLLSLET